MTMRRAVLRLHVGSCTLRAEVLRAGAVAWAGEATYASLAELADAIARLAAEAPRTCKRLTVALARPPAQLRTLPDVPPVNARHLAALVHQQAGRFFRKNGQPLITDAAWVGTGAARFARAAAVAEPVVEAVATGARAAGLWLETIAPAGEPAHLELLPGFERQNRARAARSRTRRLVMATGGVWVAAGALFLGRLAWERHMVEHELAALRQPLAAVLDARRELRDAQAALDAIATAERGRGRGLVMLAAITDALPDSSVVTSLQWSAEGSGALVGAAKHTADVVARLDHLSVLSGVRLSGPAVREVIAGREWERFTVLFGREGS